MTAIETVKLELEKIQNAQADCISDFGFVKNYMRYRYQILTQKAKEFKECLDWLETQEIGMKKRRYYNDITSD